jgi:hypothetical protein
MNFRTDGADWAEGGLEAEIDKFRQVFESFSY